MLVGVLFLRLSFRSKSQGQVEKISITVNRGREPYPPRRTCDQDDLAFERPRRRERGEVKLVVVDEFRKGENRGHREGNKCQRDLAAGGLIFCFRIQGGRYSTSTTSPGLDIFHSGVVLKRKAEKGESKLYHGIHPYILLDT